MSEGRAIALGFFDGVHLGHGALLRRTVEAAGRGGLSSCALTFDRHPEALITKTAMPLLQTTGDRADLIRRLYAVDEVIFAHFEDSLMRMPWRQFLTDMLIGRFQAAHLVAGYDFHFGHRGEGNPERLAEECARLGVGCDIIPRVELAGITVSSTYIRKLVAQGDMERAALFLGHPYSLSGVVTRGRQLGASLGAPTVNLPLPEGLQCPAHGVYVSVCHVGGNALPAVTDVGLKPTVSLRREAALETHILDFEGNLYGQSIRVDLLKFLRPERLFPSTEELREQIDRDIRAARATHENSAADKAESTERRGHTGCTQT
ncbi:MAG: riboflavin biosynthesis protein RibF [Oscillospiraceae bacterium]|jgi:riboflavin kinase/FMN adenylyltransferase|nr:riboflavin biosynthesis protein RibF [Oscillospiraceae bacterium]